ncbi:hypothetical protein KIN20_002778 [Parelaphostrongylus tenuis]|uniref:Uncharacterized protein n=1 Tax=Parelaphostrongylus tenuis TaxID=148309 RepID=A0AAD5LWA6_PARTN|nr:hypothetical protein KIN20_002778 [Parelaphostrongylus tenuis]
MPLPTMAFSEAIRGRASLTIAIYPTYAECICLVLTSCLFISAENKFSKEECDSIYHVQCFKFMVK